MMKTFQFSAILFFAFAIANINCQFSPPDGWTPPPKSFGWTPPPKSSGWTPPSGWTQPSGVTPPSKATTEGTTTEAPVIVGLLGGKTKYLQPYPCKLEKVFKIVFLNPFDKMISELF